MTEATGVTEAGHNSGEEGVAIEISTEAAGAVDLGEATALDHQPIVFNHGIRLAETATTRGVVRGAGEAEAATVPGMAAEDVDEVPRGRIPQPRGLSVVAGAGLWTAKARTDVLVVPIEGDEVPGIAAPVVDVVQDPQARVEVPLHTRDGDTPPPEAGPLDAEDDSHPRLDPTLAPEAQVAVRVAVGAAAMDEIHLRGISTESQQLLGTDNDAAVSRWTVEHPDEVAVKPREVSRSAEAGRKGETAHQSHRTHQLVATLLMIWKMHPKASSKPKFETHPLRLNSPRRTTSMRLVHPEQRKCGWKCCVKARALPSLTIGETSRCPQRSSVPIC